MSGFATTRQDTSWVVTLFIFKGGAKPPWLSRIQSSSATIYVDSKADVVYIDNMQQREPHSQRATFGDHIRKLREQRAEANLTYSLRQVASRCGITPAYLSRVERSEVSPPGEETIIKLAQDLGEDADILLAMAGKISADLRSAIFARPQLFAELIRSIKSMPDHAVLRIVRDVRDGSW